MATIVLVFLPVVGATAPAIAANTGATPVAVMPTDLALGSRLTTLFAPDDPTLETELQLIQEVIDARKADPASYADAGNPFRVRYAVESLADPQIAAKLADARDAGVHVQIIEDYRQLDPAYPWLDTDEYLAGRGFSVARDASTLSPAALSTTNVIGIVTAGFMHLKARLFETPTEKVVLTGGENASTEGWKFNEDDVQVIRDAGIFDQYERAYATVLGGGTFANSWDPTAAINVLFSPESSGPHAGTKILESIKAENTLILIQVFSLWDFTIPGSSDSLVSVLAAKAAAGVPVYVMTDKNQSAGPPTNPTAAKLRAAGVHVYEVLNTRDAYASMHAKVAVLGDSCPSVITDSANWSTAALGSGSTTAKNDESVLFINSARADSCLSGKRYLSQWLKVLSRFGYQSAADAGEPSYVDVLQRLELLPGWPTQQVEFTAGKAYTAFGEDVRVLGNTAALGGWGYTGSGVLLSTDASSYPTWKSVIRAQIPLGAWFDWKFAVTRGTGMPARWEGGSNISDFAQPSPFSFDGILHLEHDWR